MQDGVRGLEVVLDVPFNVIVDVLVQEICTYALLHGEWSGREGLPPECVLVPVIQLVW